MLNALRNAGVIASRTWSVFWGLTGVDSAHQMDGALIIGGYDAAKTDGDNFTQPLSFSSSCPTGLLVFVNEIDMLFPNGTRFAITHAGLAMCIEPTYELITMPPDVWANFFNNSGGTWETRSLGINLFGNDYAADGV